MTAWVSAVRGQHALAAAQYRRALRSDPVDPAALIAVIEDCRSRHAVAEAVEVADRALARDPDNFVALDGLAWAYLEQGDHARAKPTVERAIRALEQLGVDAPFPRAARVMIAAARVLLQFPGLRRPGAQLLSTSEMEAEAARGIAQWRAWAQEYLAWHEREHGSAGAGAGLVGVPARTKAQH